MLAEAKRVIPFLSDVVTEDLDRGGLTIAGLDAGTVAFTEGEPCRHVAFVVAGRMRVYKAAADGRELTLYHITPGQSCVLMLSSVLAVTDYPARAVAAVDSHVLLLPIPTFRRWMERYPGVRDYVYTAFARRLANVMMLVDQVLFKNMDQRLAALLLERTLAGPPVLEATHEGLALELGTAREVVSRLLKSFEHAGAVKLKRGRIRVVEIGRAHV